MSSDRFPHDTFLRILAEGMTTTKSTETASRSTATVEKGTHVFEIVGYSLEKGFSAGHLVRSGTFTVGGFDWALSFYPDGGDEASGSSPWIILELVSNGAEARAQCGVGLLKQPSGLLGCGWRMRHPRTFNSSDSSRFAPFRLKSEAELKASGFLVGDCLKMKCTLMVVKGSQLSEIKEDSEIEVPPSDITKHFGTLLEDKVGADVTFSVGGETVTAHKIVLAARSPVFKAELYGPMSETRTSCVTIQDMQPAVFRAMLHFVYTDSLPRMDDLKGGDCSEMIRHLLVASCRYALDRLKMICQNILAKNLDAETVVTTLALADQHDCERLKKVCIEFITSPNEMDAVLATQGYASLKRTCPSVLVEVLEKTSRLRRS
uniref:BTB domain-containing protein n=3 Tax=Setaria TaxID=4554 RepID=K3YN54_SETIT